MEPKSMILGVTVHCCAAAAAAFNRAAVVITMVSPTRRFTLASIKLSKKV
jgi:hypothetical protein